MIRLHLSAKEYTLAECERERLGGPTPRLEPLCGARDGVGVVRRGGWGVPPAAISPEFHCPDCVAALRRPH